MGIGEANEISFCQWSFPNYSIQLANFEVHLIKLGNAAPDESAVATRLKDLFDKVIRQGHVSTYQDSHIQWPSTCPVSLPPDQLLVYVLRDSSDSVVHTRFQPRDFAEGGGFTMWNASITASEVYVSGCDGNGAGVANMIFHEAMHNKGHWSNTQLHGDFGGHGLAGATIAKNTDLTAVNIQRMAGVLGARNAQWLGGCSYWNDPMRLMHGENSLLPRRSGHYGMDGLTAVALGRRKRPGPIGLG